MNGQNGGTTMGPGAPPPPPTRPSTGGTTMGPGAPSKTPIDMYIVGLGAMAVLLAVGYSRKYYVTNKS